MVNMSDEFQDRTCEGNLFSQNKPNQSKMKTLSITLFCAALLSLVGLLLLCHQGIAADKNTLTTAESKLTHDVNDSSYAGEWGASDVEYRKSRVTAVFRGQR